MSACGLEAEEHRPAEEVSTEQQSLVRQSDYNAAIARQAVGGSQASSFA